MAADIAQLVLETLKATSSFIALVTGGASNILETGDMLVDVLHDAEITRRSAGGSAVLGVSVQDAGETRLRGPMRQQTVVVRGLDRLNGFGAIRAVRFAAISVLDRSQGILDDGAAVMVTYTQRTGHMVDRTFGVDFEALTFVATVEVKED